MSRFTADYRISARLAIMVLLMGNTPANWMMG